MIKKPKGEADKGECERSGGACSASSEHESDARCEAGHNEQVLE